MRRIIKLGDTGEDVKQLQEALGLKVDGHFGPITLRRVKAYQASMGLNDDGIVGPITQSLLFKDMEDLDSEITEMPYEQLIMEVDEYFAGPHQPEYLFYHFTAGWHNPFNVVKSWNNDTRGRVGTEWVIGGPSIRDGSKQFDGQVVKCMPDGAWGWHLGNVDRKMQENSVGIEVCNFGPLTEVGEGFKTYTGQWADDSQIYDLGVKWRGYRYWHKYSDAQIEALRDLTLHIALKHNINLEEGLKRWLNELNDNEQIHAFDYHDAAARGKVKGLLSHSNVRRDKLDMSPQQNLIQMIKSL